jgi:hypothetical protein
MPFCRRGHAAAAATARGTPERVAGLKRHVSNCHTPADAEDLNFGEVPRARGGAP